VSGAPQARIDGYPKAGVSMPRLSSARPRKRLRCYDITFMLRQQVVATSVVRIRPIRRLFRPVGRLHF